jgi:hypothetical protein
MADAYTESERYREMAAQLTRTRELAEAVGQLLDAGDFSCDPEMHQS